MSNLKKIVLSVLTITLAGQAHGQGFVRGLPGSPQVLNPFQSVQPVGPFVLSTVVGVTQAGRLPLVSALPFGSYPNGVVTIPVVAPNAADLAAGFALGTPGAQVRPTYPFFATGGCDAYCGRRGVTPGRPPHRR